MMDRRGLLKSTLLSFGGAMATGAVASWYPELGHSSRMGAKR